jgi:hypothetical protein
MNVSLPRFLIAAALAVGVCASGCDAEPDPEGAASAALEDFADDCSYYDDYPVWPRDGGGLPLWMTVKACVSRVGSNQRVGYFILRTRDGQSAYVKATFRLELHRCSDGHGIAQYPFAGDYTTEGQHGGLDRQTHAVANQRLYTQLRITSTYVSVYGQEDYSGGGTFISTASETCR